METYKHKYLFAQNKIKQAIKNLKIDERLPGERVFAKELGISYMTIRKAVENLVEEGVLYKIPKKGTYVADPDKVELKYIGYFLDSSIKAGVSSPYYSMIFSALEREASKRGYALSYFTDSAESVSQKILEKVDGVIISCFPRIENLVQKIHEKLPVVCIDNRSPDESIPSLTIDNFNSVVDSVNYLCSLGHERIGFITGLDDSDVGKKRLAGYLSALKNHGIDEDTSLIFKGDYTFETGRTGADYFLSLNTRPTAIMCANDTMAVSAIKELSRRGLKVPDDMSIVGFDNIVISSQIIPALTTVSVPFEDIAKQAVALLDSVLNDNVPEDRHMTLPCRLVVRDSSTENQDRATPVRKLNTV
ncbi:MAG: GntR family transcriptional regulator [Gammaproteobacteria bacterium]